MAQVLPSKDIAVTLHPQHRIFADNFLATGNITKSAKAAGYAAGSAHVSGHRLLKRVDVQQYLAARGAEVTESTEDLQSRVLHELQVMAFANIGDFITIDENGKPVVDLSTADEEQLRAIASLKTKERMVFNSKGEHIATEVESGFVMSDKYRGLELLGKHLGMFKEAEQRVVVDVADRLLNARRRLAALGDDDDFRSDDDRGGGVGV